MFGLVSKAPQKIQAVVETIQCHLTNRLAFGSVCDINDILLWRDWGKPQQKDNQYFGKHK
jgi:hypothetical protein